jgi:hypothetical protein
LKIVIIKTKAWRLILRNDVQKAGQMNVALVPDGLKSSLVDMECTGEELTLQQHFTYLFILTRVLYSVGAKGVQGINWRGAVVEYSFYGVPKLRKSGAIPPLNTRV